MSTTTTNQTIKDKIIEHYNSNPKQYINSIKKDVDLYNQILEDASHLSELPFKETVCSIFFGTPMCQFGNKKQYSSFDIGWKNCGKASSCQCTKEQVSKNVSKTKLSIPPEQRHETNVKRNKTNLVKYGVANVGRLEKAKTAHKRLYENKDLVVKITDGIRKTTLKRYGVRNVMVLPETKEKIKTTNLKRYGTKSTLQLDHAVTKRLTVIKDMSEAGEFLKIGYNKFSKYVTDNYNMSLLTPFDLYTGIKQKDVQEFSFKCLECNTIFDKKFYHGRGLVCLTCNPKRPNFKSHEENAVFDFITNELGITGGIQGDRTLIMPYEIDMLFANEKIAIEYCGLYWHSEFSQGKNKDYHIQKMKMVNSTGFRLITIFSDEWKTSQSIVKSKLRHLFNKSIEKYYARKCIINDVSPVEAKEFLDNYHLQGNAQSSVRLGLYIDNKLLSLMTFGKLRKVMNSSTVNNEMELIRYATNGSHVVGGASKLLSHYIKTSKPSFIISYADLRWSNGNLYKMLGFVREKNPGPGYWYTHDYETRKHRFNFTKGRLVDYYKQDPHKTEWQIMIEMGYDRIWDCGHQKYTLKI